MPNFDPYKDHLYVANYISLLKAIQQAGGEGFRLLEQHEELLDTLARNNVKIEAKHLPDSAPKMECTFKEYDKTHSI